MLEPRQRRLAGRRVFAVMPLVDVVAGVLQVALLVEDDVADDGADWLAILQSLGDLARIVGAGALMSKLVGGFGLSASAVALDGAAAALTSIKRKEPGGCGDALPALDDDRRP